MSELKKENKIGVFIAVGGCLLLFGWFLYAVRFGLGRPDEAFNLSIAERLVNGERLLLDEWHFSQFTSFFLYLPYRIFTAVTGGTEGVILYMRRIYIGASFLTYWYVVYKMRKTPIRAAICAFLFCSYVPYAIFALEYYSLPPMLLLVVCFLLTGENARFYRGKLILCGILISCIVLMVPQLAVLYPLYCVLTAYHVFSKKKRKVFLSYDFLFNKQVWMFLSVGIVFTLTLFLLFLTITDGWGNIIRILPMLFTDSEYSSSGSGGIVAFLSYKLQFAIALFRPVNFILLCFVLAAALLYRKLGTRFKNPTYIKTIIFMLACVILIAACVSAAIGQTAAPSESFAYWFYYTVSPLPAFFFCLICYILCEKKDPRLFFFLFAGFLLTLFRDIFSDVSLGIGCILAVIPLVHVFPQLVKEIKESLSAQPVKRHFVNTKKNASLIKVSRAVILLTSTVFIAWNIWNAYTEGTHQLIEVWANGTADTVITKGPYKGVYTTAAIKETEEKTLDDLDRIAGMTDGAVYVTARLPETYLYLDRPNPAYSTWFVEADIGTRQIEYWRLHPEKRPSAIYVPDYIAVYEPDKSAEKNFSAIESYFEYEKIRGEIGTIVLISQWNLDTER